MSKEDYIAYLKLDRIFNNQISKIRESEEYQDFLDHICRFHLPNGTEVFSLLMSDSETKAGLSILYLDEEWDKRDAEEAARLGKRYRVIIDFEEEEAKITLGSLYLGSPHKNAMDQLIHQLEGFEDPNLRFKSACSNDPNP